MYGHINTPAIDPRWRWDGLPTGNISLIFMNSGNVNQLNQQVDVVLQI